MIMLVVGRAFDCVSSDERTSSFKRSMSKVIFLFLFLGICLCPRAVFAASGLFPKMQASTNLFVIDCQADSQDAKMSVWALEGLINQSAAEVYIIEKEWSRHQEQLGDCGKPFETLDPLPGSNGGLRTVFKKYQGRVKTMIIYDPDKDWTKYLSVMAAAQQSGIPVTESILHDLTSEFNWKGNVQDFRNRWNNNTEAYDWALQNLMPHCNKQVVFAGWIPLSIVDYIVASKGFAFGLDFKTDQTEIEKIFSTPGYGVGTSLMGYANTGDDANVIANHYGIGCVVSDLYANGSFWSSFPDKTYKQASGHAIPAIPGKVYVALVWSDGDNLQFDQNAIWNLWHDPARGTVPVGTTMDTALQELNTPLLDWYFAKMTTNDELLGGPGGFQFIYVNEFNDNLFPAWCQLNRSWIDGLGFRTSCLWDTTYPSPKYTNYVETSGLTGILKDGGGLWIRYDIGTPVMAEGRGSWNPNDIFDWLAGPAPSQKTPAFIGFKCIVAGYTKDNMNGYTKIKQQVDRLNAAYPGRYVFLLPKDLFATIRSYCHLPEKP
jgi:hypothetical protein